MKLGEKAPDDQFGWGLIDPVSALEELDARVADNKVAAIAKPCRRGRRRRLCRASGPQGPSP